MLIAETRWFAEKLARQPDEALAPLLNLGSQSLAFRMCSRGWTTSLFAPLRDRRVTVVHSDIQSEERGPRSEHTYLPRLAAPRLFVARPPLPDQLPHPAEVVMNYVNE